MIFSMNTKFVFHMFSFSFVASHNMSSYFGFETCVRSGNAHFVVSMALWGGGQYWTTCGRCNTCFG
jgi:hypothetical protein